MRCYLFWFICNDAQHDYDRKDCTPGIPTPDSYVPDVSSNVSVVQAVKEESVVLSAANTVDEVRKFLDEAKDKPHSAFVVVDENGNLEGVLDVHDILSSHYEATTPLKSLIKGNSDAVREDEMLESAVYKMIQNKVYILPVISNDNKDELIGMLSYYDVLQAYEKRKKEEEDESITIFVKKQTVHIFAKGRHFFLRQ